MKYSPLFFYKNTPAEKWKKEPIASKFLYRPLSFLFSTPFAYAKFTGNMVSILNLGIAIAACVLALFQSFSCSILSTAFLILWITMDNVDGNLARSLGQKKYGDFLDALSGYFLGGFYLIAFAYGSLGKKGIVFPQESPLLLLIGAVGCVSFISLLLYNKKFQENTRHYAPEPLLDTKLNKPSAIRRIAGRVVDELSFGGFFPLLALLSVIFQFEDLLVLLYAIAFALLFIFGTLLLLAKTIQANRDKNV